MPKLKLTKEHIRIVRILIGAGLLVFAGEYVCTHREELAILFTVRWWAIAVLISAGILRRLADAARFTTLYKALGARMGILESFGLSQVAGALNVVLPAQPGGAVRAVYLKHQYAIPYSQTPTILLGSFVFSLFIGALVMTLTNIIITLMGNSVPLILWVGTGCAGASVLLFWLTIPERFTSRLGRVGNMLRLFSDGWNNLRMNKRCLIKTGIYQLLTFVGSGLVITISYQSLGLDLNPLVGISIAVFTTFSNTFSITPGNLGVQEAVIGYLSQLSGMLFVQGVAAATLIRAAGLVITLGTAPIAWYLLFFRQNIRLSRGNIYDQSA